MKRIILTLVCIITIGTFSFAEDVAIKITQLPAKSQQVIKKYYSSLYTTKIIKERKHGKNMYKVDLSDGTELEFNGAGYWTEISSGKGKSISKGLIPKHIISYLSDRYENYSIIKIEKENYGHEIKLSSGEKMKFYNDSDLVEIIIDTDN